jgi:hypothetical protein
MNDKLPPNCVDKMDADIIARIELGVALILMAQLRKEFAKRNEQQNER